jgi:hypothetical protein
MLMTSLILPAPGVLEERGGPFHYPNPLPEGEGAMVLREFHSKASQFVRRSMNRQVRQRSQEAGSDILKARLVIEDALP